MHLHDVCSDGSINELIEILDLDCGGVNEKDNRGSTPLYHACFRDNSIEYIKILLEAGADVTIKNECGVMPIHTLCRGDNIEGIKIFLNAGVSINETDDSGNTPLHNACYSADHPDCIRFLLENGANINIKNHDSLRNNTPLHIACFVDNLEGIKILLEFGVDVNVKNINGSTPLHILCYKNNIEGIKTLLNYDTSSINEKDGRGDRPFDLLSPDNKIIIEKFTEDLLSLDIKEPDE